MSMKDIEFRIFDYNSGGSRLSLKPMLFLKCRVPLNTSSNKKKDFLLSFWGFWETFGENSHFKNLAAPIQRTFPGLLQRENGWETKNRLSQSPERAKSTKIIIFMLPIRAVTWTLLKDFFHVHISRKTGFIYLVIPQKWGGGRNVIFILWHIFDLFLFLWRYMKQS